MKRLTITLLAVASVALGVGVRAQDGQEPQSHDRILQQVIVKVNGEILTLTDLELRQVQALRNRNEQVQNPEDLQNDARLKAALDDVTPQVLVSAVDELLLVQRGREMGARLTDEMFKSFVERIKTENKLDDAQLTEALKAEGMSMDEYRDMLEHQYLENQVTQDLMGHLNLTEQEARQYYQSHQDEFMKPATVTLRELLVSVPTQTQGGQVTFSAGLDDAAKEKITGLRTRAVNGEDFAKLVQEASDAGSKANGGLIGPINVSEMSDTLKAAVDKLQPGGVSEPIRVAAGYELFQLETRSDAVPQPFDQVRDEIAQHVFDTRRDAELKKYLKTLRAQALIEWKNDDMRKLYEKGLTAGDSGIGLGR